ncbi:MAG: hypothetical protein ACU0C9_05060 [Paracoccaceae bacterium]
MNSTVAAEPDILIEVRDVVRHITGPRSSIFGKRRMAAAALRMKSGMAQRVI